LSAAASLAAEIKDVFDINPELVEGHGGIYEVIVNRAVLYTNQGKCGQLPRNEEVLLKLLKYKDPLPGKEGKLRNIFPMI
jgi:hypothetical protein